MAEDQERPLPVEFEWGIDENDLIWVDCTFEPREPEDEQFAGMAITFVLPRFISTRLIQIQEVEQPESSDDSTIIDGICQYLADVLAYAARLSASFAHATLHDPFLGILSQTIISKGLLGLTEQVGEHTEAYLEGISASEQMGEEIRRFRRLLRGDDHQEGSSG